MFDGVDSSVVPMLVGPDMWPTFAVRVRPHLEKMAAGSGGRYAADDIAAFIALGRMQLWLALRGADIMCVVLTEIVQYPRVRAMRIVALVGHDHRKWLRLTALLEHSARVNFGCQKFEALYPRRMGLLVRLLGGWREFHILSEKDLI